jgi:hypothetical protein
LIHSTESRVLDVKIKNLPPRITSPLVLPRTPDGEISAARLVTISSDPFI